MIISFSENIDYTAQPLFYFIPDYTHKLIFLLKLDFNVSYFHV